MIRTQGSKLAIEMPNASLSLLLATAIAAEQGETNGERKTAREQTEAAQEECEYFIHELALM